MKSNIIVSGKFSGVAQSSIWIGGVISPVTGLVFYKHLNPLPPGDNSTGTSIIRGSK